MIVVDSREKKNLHILKYFETHNIDYIVQKMDVADYQIKGRENLVIDRKQNLDELSRNLTNRSDHARFWKEIRRANGSGIKLIILCEHGGQIKSIPDVAKWHSKYSPVSGRALMEEIYRVHIAYSVEFIFCEKWQTAQLILELLKGEKHTTVI